MNNKEIAGVLKLSAQLMELHNENPFKIKSLNNAAYKIGKMDTPLITLAENELEAIDGIGKSIAAKITELKFASVTKELEALLNKTPLGVVDMLGVKGIGPKKVAQIWQELAIESIGELLYACNENRLIDLKGFGSKTQAEIIKSIEFIKTTEGKFHYATIEPIANDLFANLKSTEGTLHCEYTGAFRRKNEVIEQLEFIVATQDKNNITELLTSKGFVKQEETTTDYLLTQHFQHENGIELIIHFSTPELFYYNLFQTTLSKGSKLFTELKTDNYPNEAGIFETISAPYIVPEAREDIYTLDILKSIDYSQLIEHKDLKGILHLHTTYSDGIHTLKEMATHAKESGFEYIGVCDHSKSAGYANGLSIERVYQQHEEIELLNKELAPFKIFKGIESDILSDGALDYLDEVLQQFDFIIASVHSNLKMDEAKATQRIITAVESKYTTILGHPTGRLLLSRAGYPINHEKVIDACAANGVIIELNAHPYRLDIDWRWIYYATQKGVKISINPDSHNKSGYKDMYYGVNVARKGLLTKPMTFNALNKEEIESYFKGRK